MPTLLSRNIGTLASIKDNKYQLDIQTVPVPIKTTKPTTEQTTITQKTVNEDKYQHQHNAVSPTYQPEISDMSIWEAAERANISIIRHYLDRTAPHHDRTTLVNLEDPTTGATLLHLAISHAPALTENSSQADKDIALRLELVNLLLENGAHPATCNLYSVQAIHMVPLHIPTNSLPYLIALLDHGANINALDGDGWTPLHYAARFCQPPTLVMQALVAHGANVNAKDHTNNKSCLFGLIANGDHVDCFQWMIETAKANVQLRGQFNFTPTTDQHGNNRTPTIRSQQQPYLGPGDTIKQATLILQAAKYGRLGILRYLIHTPKMLNKLRSLISLEEIEQARHVARQHSTDKHREHWELIDTEIHHLSCLLEHDPRSLVSKQTKSLATGTSFSFSIWVTQGQQQQRKLARKIRTFLVKPKQLIQW